MTLHELDVIFGALFQLPNYFCFQISCFVLNPICQSNILVGNWFHQSQVEAPFCVMHTPEGSAVNAHFLSTEEQCECERTFVSCYHVAGYAFSNAYHYSTAVPEDCSRSCFLPVTMEIFCKSISPAYGWMCPFQIQNSCTFTTSKHEQKQAKKNFARKILIHRF